MKILVTWFNGNGARAGAETTTLEELRFRLSGGKATEVTGLRGPIFRLTTGEVARCRVS